MTVTDAVCVHYQDRATFRRLIVKNNAKKRRLYEQFVESVPLLKSLEVRGGGGERDWRMLMMIDSEKCSTDISLIWTSLFAFPFQTSVSVI